MLWAYPMFHTRYQYRQTKMEISNDEYVRFFSNHCKIILIIITSLSSFERVLPLSNSVETSSVCTLLDGRCCVFAWSLLLCFWLLVDVTLRWLWASYLKSADPMLPCLYKRSCVHIYPNNEDRITRTKAILALRGILIIIEYQ